MTKIILPKTDAEGVPYLSYSQINTWLKSKRDYIRQYFIGEKDDNAGLQKYGDFGSKVGEALENNDFSGFEPDEVEFLKTVPRYDEFEREIRLEMDGYFVKGYIDTNTKVEQCQKGKPEGYIKKIIDYKTGDIAKKTSDYSSEDYLQIEIYGAALEQEFGQAPDEGEVVLIGRDGNAFAGQELKLTKEYTNIYRDMTSERLEAVKAKVDEVAEEISQYYQVYLSLNGLL